MNATTVPPECIPPDGPIPVDSDLAGPGVLTAFFVSAVITILAVIGGYLSQSLDDALLDDLDRKVISWSSSKIQKLFRIDETSFISKREARKEAVTLFILTLSDQQLVTGLAILVSGTLNKDRLTIYELSMLLSLAWFSTTTHLATLDALQIYLKKHRFIRHIRVGGMLAVLVLLFYLNFIMPASTSTMARSVPLRCWYARKEDEKLHPSSTVASYLGVITVILFTLWAYSVRIYPLYRDTTVHVWGRGRSSSSFDDEDRRQVSGEDKHFISQPQQEEQEDEEEERISRRAFLRATHLRALRSKPLIIRKFLGAGFLLSRSFLWSFLLIWFSFSFGLTNLVLQRWVLAPRLDGNSGGGMGFGQVTSIFLLLLPFLSAGQGYYGYIQDQRHLAHDDVHRSYPDMASTVGFTESTVGVGVEQGFTADTLTITTQYASQKAEMTPYLAGDIFHIRNMEYTSEEVKQTIVDMKRAVLNEYHRLKEVEKDVSLTTSLWLFAGYVVLHGFFAAQLNLVNVIQSTAVNFSTILLLPFIILVFIFDLLSVVYLSRRPRGLGKYLVVTGGTNLSGVS